MSEEFELSVVGGDWPQGLYCLASALYLFSILHLGGRAWLDKNLEEKIHQIALYSTIAIAPPTLSSIVACKSCSSFD